MDTNQEFIGQRVIIRARYAGVFFGTLEAVSGVSGNEVILTDVRRIWYWAGAASLSQLSQEGVKRPNECKFPCLIKKMKIFEVIEIIPTTKEAQDSIDSVPIWASKD